MLYFSVAAEEDYIEYEDEEMQMADSTSQHAPELEDSDRSVKPKRQSW